MNLLKSIILVLFCTTFSAAHAGYVKGKIIDENGDPLPFASIYVSNTSYGVASDMNGNYFLELKNGNYSVTYSFVGYLTETRDVTIGRDPLIINITLKSMSLDEVEIVADTKDRAKSIMKKVRDKRKFYLDQIENYSCKTYLKTSLEKESNEIIVDSLLSNVPTEGFWWEFRINLVFRMIYSSVSNDMVFTFFNCINQFSSVWKVFIWFYFLIILNNLKLLAKKENRFIYL